MVTDVRENWATPGGWNPLSSTESHSYPKVPGWKVYALADVAREVLRHSRILPYAAGTVSESLRTPFTVKIWPSRAFSGRPPSFGGLKRGSRQVPVHTVGPGST